MVSHPFWEPLSGVNAAIELDSVTAVPQEHSFDQSAIDQLTGMGFPEIRAKRALLKTGNNGAEVAMNWLFEHMDDQGRSYPESLASM